MKKICTVVGARPQFIKAAAGSRILRQTFQEVLIHTGQHYDANMSDVFFQEMEIPVPDYHLGVCGGSHGQMTGRMLEQVEEILLKEQPDGLLVYGDTNSTLAGALAAVKLHIPVFHVEAGTRLAMGTGRRKALENPEEVNRICTDHVSSLLLCATDAAYQNLVEEGLADGAYVVGNIMYDSFLHFAGRDIPPTDLTGLDGTPVALPESFYYMTCHRQENTDTDEALREILSAMNALDAPTVYPVHPRNHARALRLCQGGAFPNILLIQPVKYSDSVYLVSHAKRVVTDSGGLQCESFYAKRPCVTVFYQTGWVETLHNDCNQLARPDREDILAKLAKPVTFDPSYNPFGDGHAAEKVTARIKEFLEK